MMAVQKHLATFLLLLSCAAAQSTGATSTVQSVAATQRGADVRVEITLTAPVTPSIETALHPDRILLDFPDTSCFDNVKNVTVNANGVARVRTGQHSTSPFVTRLVVDLDQAHPYTLRTDGNRVILTVGPAEIAHRRSSHGAPVAATSGNLIGVFRRGNRDTVQDPVLEDKKTYSPTPEPPASVAQSTAPATTTTASSTLPPEPPRVSAPASRPANPASQESAAAQPSFDQNQVVTPAPAAKAEPVAGVPAPPPSVGPSDSKPVESAQVASVPAAQSTAGNFEPPAPVSSTPAPPPAVKADDTAASRPVESIPPAVTDSQPSAKVETASAAPPAISVPESVAPASAKENPGPVTTAETSPSAAEISPGLEGEKAAPALPATGSPEPTSSTGPMLIARSDDPSLRTVFKVKYVADGVAYLEGGRAQGLKEGMKLEVQDNNLPAKQGDSVNAADPRVVAELEVTAVAESSAVTDIHLPKRAVKAGDLAYLSAGDAEALVQQRTLSATRQYPAVISFTEGDTLDEEARQEVPRPPLPSVNRARGRIGLDYMNTFGHGANSVTSSDVGIVFRGDITRIGGSYWNLSGYWRGRITKATSSQQQTLQDLINRTYHLNLTYDNPNSNLVAGFGRLYLPWAPSLDTLDGGYFGVRLSHGATLGIFAGSTPDPSSWNYEPDRALGGTFVNFDGGEYDGFHYSSTAGVGISMIKWAIDRPFLFFEDNLSYKRVIAIYESAQLDSPKGTLETPAPGAGLGRNFFTFRVNPVSRVEVDFNYNYFRDVPTFDKTLVGTGLLDKFLFQGFSVGGRVEVVKQVWLSTNLGRSNRTGDPKSSFNEMFGVTFGRLPLKIRADAHYAKFNSAFGSGSYESVSLSRQVSDQLRLELLAGSQKFASTAASNNRAKFLTGTVETTLGAHYYLQGNFTTNRGDLSYDQIQFSMGYRFDSKKRRE